MKKVFRFPFWLIGAIALVLIFAAIVCLKPFDSTPYQQCNFYKNEMAVVDNIPAALPEINNQNAALQVGWARVNLLPPFTTPIAIDADRGGKHFTGVHDSVYVRAFVFKHGNTKIAYISADLLIIPPTVSKMFDTLLAAQGFDSRNIYFTATHTHTSIGAWHKSYVGEIFAGKYDARIPIHIANCISKAIIAAEKNCTPAQVGYAEIPTTKLVVNRLVHQKGKVDSLLRIVKIQNVNGEKAAIITFAAHCTVFHKNMMQITGDWAGMMMDRLDTSNSINFSSFSAGAVGSHGPYEISNNQEKQSAYLANHVSELVLKVFDSIPVQPLSIIQMRHIPLYLGQPQMRITQNIVIRPWLFKKLFGDEKVYLNTLQLGNIFFAGTPCDYSGELDYSLEPTAKKDCLHLMLTSFNGGYIGYVTDTKWYTINAYETRTMGWFGPSNGDYFNEIIIKLMDKSTIR